MDLIIFSLSILVVVQPAELGTSVSITLEEQDALLYRPQEGEWGDGDSDSQCERIICAIDQLLNMGKRLSVMESIITMKQPINHYARLPSLSREDTIQARHGLSLFYSGIWWGLLPRFKGKLSLKNIRLLPTPQNMTI